MDEGKRQMNSMRSILCRYIKGKEEKVCQESPCLPVELNSTGWSQDDIGWDNIMQRQISSKG